MVIIAGTINTTDIERARELDRMIAKYGGLMTMSTLNEVMDRLVDYVCKNEKVTSEEVKRYSISIKDECGNELINAGFGIADNSELKLFLLNNFMEAIGNTLFNVLYGDESINKSAEHIEKYNKYWKKKLESLTKDLKDRSVGGNIFNYDKDGDSYRLSGFYSLFKVSGYEDISIGEKTP